MIYHQYSLKSGHAAVKIQRDFDKFGENAFSWELLEEVDEVSSLREREDYYMKKFNAIEKGFNSKTLFVGDSVSISAKVNPDVKHKITKLCKSENISRSEWLIQAIMEKLERDKISE